MPMIGEQTVSSTKTRPRKKSTPKRNKQANKNLSTRLNIFFQKQIIDRRIDFR